MEVEMDTEEALKRLESFRELKQNWDSYGGLPIHPAAIDRAKKLIEGFFVCPISDGNKNLLSNSLATSAN